jgi:thymidylate synthase
MLNILKTSDIRKEFKRLLANEEFVIDRTGAKTVEIVGASFMADVSGIVRRPSYGYVADEIEWYESQSLFVKDIPNKTPAIWASVADRDGMINSNYGYLIYGIGNGEQFKACRDELLRNPDSRRAVMVYQRPSIHKDFDRNGMNDFICTNAVQYVIRNGQLDCIVQMRSNDAVFGYCNDMAWQDYILKKLRDDLRTKGLTVNIGNIHWQVGSLHVYERHFKYIENSHYV